MEKLRFILLLLLLNAQGISAQHWFQADYHWTTKVTGLFSGGFDLDLSFGGDTIIHGLPCKKWLSSGSWLGEPPSFTYSDSTKAYFYYVQQDTFIKIYDMSLQVGDQVVIPMYNYDFIYQVDSIDTIQIGNLQLKHQYVHFDIQSFPVWHWKFDILENIGVVDLNATSHETWCTYVMIPRLRCDAALDGPSYQFKCFSSNFGDFHPYGPACTSSVQSPDHGMVELLPNPTEDFFEIHTNQDAQKFQAIELRDAFGNTLRSWDGLQQQFAISDLPSGMYFVYFNVKDGAPFMKKLVRE